MKIAIVGAGASGLMAAIAAKLTDCDCTLFEKLPKPGAKILASGGGRCNLTNTASLSDFLKAFGKHGKFMRSALQDFSSEDLSKLFDELNVPTYVADGFHIFPKSDSAVDVQQALINKCKQLGVKFERAEVSEIIIKDGQACGVIANNETREFDKIIIATGGKGYPELGGGAYNLLEQTGHTVTPLFPALASIRCKEGWPKDCAGLGLKNIDLYIDLPKFKKQKVSGDLLFTHEGISGPAALNISGQVNELCENESIMLKINLAPYMTEDKWLEKFQEWTNNEPTKLLTKLLSKYVPKRLSELLCSGRLMNDLSEVAPSDFSKVNRRQLAQLLSALPLTAKPANFEKAMVTRGGVSLKEVDPRTMQSRLTENLFIVGEALDLDGPCGGYNLQWAFSSGHLAGKSAIS